MIQIIYVKGNDGVVEVKRIRKALKDMSTQELLQNGCGTMRW